MFLWKRYRQKIGLIPNINYYKIKMDENQNYKLKKKLMEGLVQLTRINMSSGSCDVEVGSFKWGKKHGIWLEYTACVNHSGIYHEAKTSENFIVKRKCYYEEGELMSETVFDASKPIWVSREDQRWKFEDYENDATY